MSDIDIHDGDTDSVIAAPPCQIHLKNNSIFTVKDIDAWQWHPRGIFATGFWDYAAGDREHDVLIYDANIDHIDFNFAAVMDGDLDAVEGGENNA